MERAQQWGRSIFAGLFLVLLFGYSALNVWHQKDILSKEAEGLRQNGFAKSVSKIDSTLAEELLGKYVFIEGYGAIQLLQGKKEQNGFDLVKDRAGYLYSGNFWTGFHDDPKELAVRVRRLQDRFAAQGTQVGFVLFPMKIAREETRYTGLPYNDFSGQADSFLRWLCYYGVPHIDLRETLAGSGLSWEECFFRTDHHWTPRAAFEGFRGIVGWMNEEFGAQLDADGHLRDLQNYEEREYPAMMLGSQGRDAGLLFSDGVEDYTALLPKKEGFYTWEHGQWGAPEALERQEGGITRSLMEPDLVIEDIYTDPLNAIYLKEACAYDHIVNHALPEGPKVLLLRDSFASPAAVFLAQGCAELDMLWTLQYSPEEIEAFLDTHSYDYILIALYPENLSNRSFPFYESEAEE